MFDGPDGVGKTTQINLAYQKLTDQNYEVHITRSHGGTEIGELLREISFRQLKRQALTDHYISMAIHAELRHNIARRRAEGVHILVDRSPLSNWAYQVHGGGLEHDFAKADIERSLALFAPDVIICYRADLATLRQHMRTRANKPSEDYFESLPDSFYKKVLEGYADAAERFGAVVLDASGSIEAVHEATMTQLHLLFDHQ